MEARSAEERRARSSTKVSYGRSLRLAIVSEWVVGGKWKDRTLRGRVDY